jgi:hypothetical protein
MNLLNKYIKSLEQSKILKSGVVEKILIELIKLID